MSAGRMTETKHLMVKVVLVGDKGVGKTSLIHRFVKDIFDDRYLLTLGAKVEKKVANVEVPSRGLRVELDMNIWDIMGQPSFRELGKEAYFRGARGIILVVDRTRRDTLATIGDWAQAVTDVTGPIPTVLVANKKDLAAQATFMEPDLAEAARRLGCPYFQASAKTGENVEAVFSDLSRRIVRAHLKM